jgi:molybdate transport system substrate-binding protein
MYPWLRLEGTMFRKLSRTTFYSLLLASAFTSVNAARAQDLTVMSSGGFEAPYKLLAPRFEKASGLHLHPVWGPSMGTTPGAIPMRLSRNEPADVVIMARSELDSLAKKGVVVEGSQVNLVNSRIGMVVRAGAKVPDITTEDSFKQTLLAAKSIAYSDSASGVYISSELYKRLGLEKELAPKSKRILAEPVGEGVARGESEIGFQQMSELKPVSGITVVGPIPDELQKITVFAAGVVTVSQHKGNARALIQFLASPEACPVIVESALEPTACAPSRK